MIDAEDVDLEPTHEDQAEAVRRVFEHIFKDWPNVGSSGKQRVYIFGIRSIVMARVMFPEMFGRASMRKMARHLDVSVEALSRNVKRLERRVGADARCSFDQSKK